MPINKQAMPTATKLEAAKSKNCNGSWRLNGLRDHDGVIHSADDNSGLIFWMLTTKQTPNKQNPAISKKNKNAGWEKSPSIERKLGAAKKLSTRNATLTKTHGFILPLFQC